MLADLVQRNTSNYSPSANKNRNSINNQINAKIVETKKTRRNFERQGEVERNGNYFN